MFDKKLLVTLFVLVPMLAVAAPYSSTSESYPTFIRFSLAGGNLVDDAGYTKYDPKARYYLLATGDCDGASIDLILTPSPASSGRGDDREFANNKSVKRVVLPRLRNGKGVNIGDSPQQVQKKLGARPHHVWVKKDLRQLEWVYYANIFMKSRQARGMQNYRATYTFRNARLWSVHYNVHEADGCD